MSHRILALLGGVGFAGLALLSACSTRYDLSDEALVTRLMSECAGTFEDLELPVTGRSFTYTDDPQEFSPGAVLFYSYALLNDGVELVPSDVCGYAGRLDGALS